jgi:hypothetical protein
MPYENQIKRPNTGMQRTALRARKIVAFLKAGISRAFSRSIGAPPLMPNPLGCQHQCLHHDCALSICYNTVTASIS